MLTKSFRLYGFVILFGAASFPAAAQAPGGGGTVPNISPVRVEFTRPAGMPGSPRSIAAPKTEYMIAPAQPDTVIVPKKPVRR